MDSLTPAQLVGVVLLAWLLLLIGLALGYWLARKYPPVPILEPATDVLTELADLRHLKAQLDNPPMHHEHIWPREPDIRKMGWLRYRCAYSGCPAVDWRPS